MRSGPQTFGPEGLVREESGLFPGAISLRQGMAGKEEGGGSASRPVIQDKIPPSKPLLRLILLIPGEKEGMIQDKIVLQRQSRRTFAAYG